MDGKRGRIGYLFVQVVKVHMDRARTLFASLGLSRGQPPVLLVLGEKDGQTQSALCEKLNIRAASLSTILQRMEQRDLVRRQSHQNDHRAVEVYLTEEGRMLMHQAREALEDLEDEMLYAFSDEDKELLYQMLQRMKANLSQPGGCVPREDGETC